MKSEEEVLQAIWTPVSDAVAEGDKQELFEALKSAFQQGQDVGLEKGIHDGEIYERLKWIHYLTGFLIEAECPIEPSVAWDLFLTCLTEVRTSTDDDRFTRESS